MFVFLHGWGMNRLVFEGFVQQYLSGESVLLLDLPDYTSQTNEVSDFEQQVEQLKQKIPQHAHLIAWSLGGLYALRLIHRFPQHIKKLTLVGSSPCFAQKENFPYALTDDLLDQFSQQLLLNRDKTIERFLLLQLHGQKQAKLIARELKQQLAQIEPPSNAVLQQGLMLLKTLDLREELRQSKVPLEIILGDRDMLVPIKVVDDLKKLRDDVVIHEMKGAAHIPFITHSEEFLSLVVD